METIIYECVIHPDLLEKLQRTIRQNQLPIHVQYGLPSTDDDGVHVCIEYPAGFGLNEVLCDIINAEFLDG